MRGYYGTTIINILSVKNIAEKENDVESVHKNYEFFGYTFKGRKGV